jgi:hypothetical protein
MCGRFTNRYSWRELKELYDITTPWLTSNFPPQFNIAPTQMSFVVRLDRAGARELAEMKWGLIPSWSKDAKGGFSTFNAKAETVAEKPTFRAAFRQRPCLVVADGFYEWKKLPGGEKQPYPKKTTARRKIASSTESSLSTGFGKSAGTTHPHQSTGEITRVRRSMSAEERQAAHIDALASYLPVEDGSVNRDLGSMQGPFMRFGSKHNDIYPIVGDMIRWQIGLPSRRED